MSVDRDVDETRSRRRLRIDLDGVGATLSGLFDQGSGGIDDRRRPYREKHVAARRLHALRDDFPIERFTKPHHSRPDQSATVGAVRRDLA